MVERVRLTDEEGFERVVQRFWARTLLYTQHMGCDPDRAYDLTQEAFARLWERRATWEDSGSVRVWLFRTVRHLIISEERKLEVRSAWASRARYEEDSTPPTPIQEFESMEIRAVILRAVEDLAPRRREVFRLFHLQGLSYREIGEIMEIRPRTVANHLQAAIADLRTALTPYFPALAGTRSDREGSPGGPHI